MVTFSAPSASETLRDFNDSLMASRISALARRRKRWRLPRLLDFGLRRRSTICMSFLATAAKSSMRQTARTARGAHGLAALAGGQPPQSRGCGLARFLHPHVPFDQAAHLAWRVATLDHALHELFVLFLGLAVLLLAKGDH